MVTTRCAIGYVCVYTYICCQLCIRVQKGLSSLHIPMHFFSKCIQICQLQWRAFVGETVRLCVFSDKYVHTCKHMNRRICTYTHMWILSCMCVCLYACMCACHVLMHTCMHVCMYVFRLVLICLFLCVCMCTYTFSSFICLHLSTHAYICIHVDFCMCVWQVYVNVCRHKCIYIYTRTCT